MPPIVSQYKLTTEIQKSIKNGWLPCLLANWELARAAYQAMLDSDDDWSDQALSRCQNYHQLLSAGLALSRLCGQEALDQLADALATSCPKGRKHHFFHLWRGLLPNPVGERKLHA